LSAINPIRLLLAEESTYRNGRQTQLPDDDWLVLSALIRDVDAGFRFVHERRVFAIRSP
jgi:hypothetical protein